MGSKKLLNLKVSYLSFLLEFEKYETSNFIGAKKLHYIRKTLTVEKKSSNLLHRSRRTIDVFLSQQEFEVATFISSSGMLSRSKNAKEDLQFLVTKKEANLILFNEIVVLS